MNQTETEPGNCLATCVAMVTGLDIDMIMDFENYQDKVSWKVLLRIWCDSQGLTFTVTTNESDAVNLSKNGYYIAIGKSPRNIFDHAVIHKDFKLYHDPYDESGLVGKPKIFIVIK